MEKTSINLAEELVRLSAATIFELRGEWPAATDAALSRSLDARHHL